MKDICEEMIKLLREDQAFVIATILTKSGSAPREEGTKMLIKKDFSIIGTIGGGILEALTIKLSSDVFENKEYIIKDFALSTHDAASIGMVCGGDVTVLLEYVDPSDDNMVKIYEKAYEFSKNGIDFVMLTKLSEKIPYLSGRDKWICTETGFYGVEDDEVLSIAKSIREEFNHIKIKLVHEKEKYVREPFLHFEKVCIIGAGHIAQKIAELTKNLGFYTVVVDDREEFANRERFQMAHEVKVIPSYQNLSSHLRINSNSYIVIVTRGHSYDKEVLAQALRTDAKYIGMIGSRTKKEHTYQELLKEGFIPEDLKRVYCPIGLDIHAQTPEEIAISIIAELIKVRRGLANEKE
jgi:xanthine dehydrogenase accessory factor